MEDGPYRARRPAGGRRRAPEDPEDVLARHGLLGSGPEAAPSEGRAARRRAAEEQVPGYGQRVVGGVPDRWRRDGEWARDDGGNGHRSAPPYDSPERPRRQHRNGYAATDERPHTGARHVEPPSARSEAAALGTAGWGGHAAPTTAGGGRRRAPEPFDAPSGSNGHRHPLAPETSTAGPATGPRRRRLDPADDPGARDAATAGGGRRHRSDADSPAFPAGGRRPAEPIGPTAPARRRPGDDPSVPVAAAPSTTGARRRRQDPAEDPARSARTHRADTGAPATTALPAAGGTRRRLDPTGDPAPPTAATSGRRRAADPDDPAPSGRRWTTDTPERSDPAVLTRDARRGGPDGSGSFGDIRAGSPHTATTAIPASGTRRRRVDPDDDPAFPATDERRRRTEPAGTSAATAIPAAATRRRTEEAPPGTGADRRRPDPPVGTPARGTRARPADTGAPATTALPTSGGTRRRRLDAPDDPATSERRRPTEPAGTSATTAIPAAAARRRHADDPPDERRRHPTDDAALPTGTGERRRSSDTVGPSATTAIPAAAAGRERTARPADGSRRHRPDAESPATTALPVGARGLRDVAGPDATAVVPAAGRSSSEPDVEADGPAATTRVRSVPRDSERPDRDDDARTRAMRIDETLTRLTAAHAGLTLAVTDRPPVDEKTSVPRRRGVGATAVRLLAGALALLVLGATAFGWGTKTWLGSSVRDAAALDPESSAVVDAAAQSGDDNVLVVATDPAGEEGQPRADTVAVAHIPDGGGPVTVLAFPLDLEINRPPCERWDAGAATYADVPVPAEARTQLVSALDLGGPRCITRVVQQLSGLAITKYVGINLAAVPAMTDAVGGAEVCVPRPVLDGVLGPVVPDAGPNRLAGVRVADFVQAGDVEGEPSAEYGRIERQQQVLAAVLDSAVSGTALLDVGRLATLRPTLADAVLTDGAGIDQVLALAMTLRRLDADGVQFVTVPTGEQSGRGNAVLRDTDAAALFAAVRADEPLPAEATEPGGGTAGPVPSDVTVQVFNASARSGLAGEVGETLRSLGFDVGEIGSAEEPSSETVIRFSPDQAAAAELLATTVPSANSVPDPGATGVLQLVLGRSFDDVVRAPSEPIALSAPTADAAPAEPAVTCA